MSAKATGTQFYLGVLQNQDSVGEADDGSTKQRDVWEWDGVYDSEQQRKNKHEKSKSIDYAQAMRILSGDAKGSESAVSERTKQFLAPVSFAQRIRKTIHQFHQQQGDNGIGISTLKDLYTVICTEPCGETGDDALTQGSILHDSARQHHLHNKQALENKRSLHLANGGTSQTRLMPLPYKHHSLQQESALLNPRHSKRSARREGAVTLAPRRAKVRFLSIDFDTVAKSMKKRHRRRHQSSSFVQQLEMLVQKRPRQPFLQAWVDQVDQVDQDDDDEQQYEEEGGVGLRANCSNQTKDREDQSNNQRRDVFERANLTHYLYNDTGLPSKPRLTALNFRRSNVHLMFQRQMAPQQHLQKIVPTPEELRRTREAAGKQLREKIRHLSQSIEINTIKEQGAPASSYSPDYAPKNTVRLQQAHLYPPLAHGQTSQPEIHNLFNAFQENKLVHSLRKMNAGISSGIRKQSAVQKLAAGNNSFRAPSKSQMEPIRSQSTQQTAQKSKTPFTALKARKQATGATAPLMHHYPYIVRKMRNGMLL